MVERHDEQMNVPYRLDMALDLFELNVEGTIVILDQAELELVMSELRDLRANWPEPKAVQIWSAVARALGRDPRMGADSDRGAYEAD